MLEMALYIKSLAAQLERPAFYTLGKINKISVRSQAPKVTAGSMMQLDGAGSLKSLT